MAVPKKFQKMNTFWKYYKGDCKAPVLTIFIGGNHEASNHLQELPYGGWVAPNIYYLGYSGVINVAGVRIGGLSGIYKARDFNRGHYEHPPYSDDTKRSVYHVRNVDVFRLKQLKQHVDIFLSHDWPRRVYRYGNCEWLLKKKPFFRDEVASDSLGSPAAEDLLFHLKPTYWFSAHLHVKFSALIEHKNDNGPSTTTKFLALDKCLPRRQFLQVIEVPHNPQKPIAVELDLEWLTILKLTNHLVCLQKSMSYMPGPGTNERWNFSPTEEELADVMSDFGGMLQVPENFSATVPVHDINEAPTNAAVPQIVVSAQTSLLCDMLGIVHPFVVFSGGQAPQGALGVGEGDSDSGHTSESDEDEGVHGDITDSSYNTNLSHNPDEISLDDFDIPSTYSPEERASPPPDGAHAAASSAVQTFNSPPAAETDKLTDANASNRLKSSVAERLRESFASLPPATDNVGNIVESADNVSSAVDNVSSAVTSVGSAVDTGPALSIQRTECNEPTASISDTARATAGRKLKRRNQSMYSQNEGEESA